MIKTLIVDGQWLLKRNFFSAKTLLGSTGELCGALVGSISCIKKTIDKIHPDKIVVFYDGWNSGLFRFQCYPAYKANRSKKWDQMERAIVKSGADMTPEEKEDYEIIRQKMQLKNILENLFVRQAEVDFIEADDLIGEYVLQSESDDETIYIFSRDKDYLQLVSDKVFMISPDNMNIIDKEEYRKKYGSIVENELLIKSFEGCDSDGIKGIGGVKRKTLLKYFPRLATEKYTYKMLAEESYEKKKESNLKVYDKVIDGKEVLYLNAKLINLKKPFINEEGKKLVSIVKHGILENDRSITNAIKLISEYGIMDKFGEQYIQDYLAPFLLLSMKEKDYAKQMLI